MGLGAVHPPLCVMGIFNTKGAPKSIASSSVDNSNHFHTVERSFYQQVNSAINTFFSRIFPNWHVFVDIQYHDWSHHHVWHQQKHRGLTVVNESVFGFTAIALGDGFLVPSHTTGGVYIMEATGGFLQWWVFPKEPWVFPIKKWSFLGVPAFKETNKSWHNMI